MISEAAIRELVIKKSRRDLLTVLKLFYPCCSDYETLALSLPTIEHHYLRIDLSYLLDKGYVKWSNEQPNMKWADRIYKLTAAGVETADKINKDPAIEA